MPKGSDGENAAKLISFLKTEARLLHRQAQKNDTLALNRIGHQCPSVQLGAELQRKHCLAAVAREIGFPNWKAVINCFEMEASTDFAKFLHPKRCHIFWNIWLATYDEAAKVHADHGGFLLTYENQFIVVDDDYVSALGAKSDNALWAQIGRNWAKPKDYAARSRLSLLIVKAHFDTGP